MRIITLECTLPNFKPNDLLRKAFEFRDRKEHFASCACEMCKEYRYTYSAAAGYFCDSNKLFSFSSFLRSRWPESKQATPYEELCGVILSSTPLILNTDSKRERMLQAGIIWEERLNLLRPSEYWIRRWTSPDSFVLGLVSGTDLTNYYIQALEYLEFSAAAFEERYPIMVKQKPLRILRPTQY